MAYNIGDRVMVVGDDLYLGRWIRVGSKGTIVDGPSLDTYLYMVRMDDDKTTYSLAPAEFVKEHQDG